MAFLWGDEGGASMTDGWNRTSLIFLRQVERPKQMPVIRGEGSRGWRVRGSVVILRNKLNQQNSDVVGATPAVRKIDQLLASAHLGRRVRHDFEDLIVSKLGMEAV